MRLVLSDSERKKLNQVPDSFFYNNPRICYHVDDGFLENLTSLYRCAVFLSVLLACFYPHGCLCFMLYGTALWWVRSLCRPRFSVFFFSSFLCLFLLFCVPFLLSFFPFFFSSFPFRLNFLFQCISLHLPFVFSFCSGCY